MDNFVPNLDNFPWDKVTSMDIDDFKAISDETFQFALEEANHDQVFESALESLKQKNSEATFEEAEKLVEVMKKAARNVLESRK
jgi:CO dehydrogenase/acetyl-CoA synthase alpha subunit